MSEELKEYDEVIKLFNPYHEKKSGRFTSKSGAHGGKSVGEKKDGLPEGRLPTTREKMKHIEKKGQAGKRMGVKIGAAIGAVVGVLDVTLGTGTDLSVGGKAISAGIDVLAGAATGGFIGKVIGRTSAGVDIDKRQREYDKKYALSKKKLEEDGKDAKSKAAFSQLKTALIEAINSGGAISYPTKGMKKPQLAFLKKLGFSVSGESASLSTRSAKSLVIGIDQALGE
jgi:hypothetical protein